ncbi:MAG: alkene reductase [Halieaceae bacterium]|jgi:N-ethylmaleimide reductase|nr:alkene reductase [Halieaceae bacterium]
MDLFSPVTLGALQLRNRIVMAPMTRSRGNTNATPTEIMAEYYRQRASAGLIVSEGIAPTADGIGYCRTPGIYNSAQVEAWRPVLDAVHAEGGIMVAQIMHVGRISNALNKAAGSETVAPSAIVASGEMYTDQEGMQPFDHPRALETEEVAKVVNEYRLATINAFAAGFDGVELHCTSGYLPAQFLCTGTNQRTDKYGGSVSNRARFVLDVLKAMSDVKGPGHVGVRICPDNPFNDLVDDNPQQTFEFLLQEAATLNLAYLHVIRLPGGRVDNVELGRRYFGDRLIGNDNYGLEEAQAEIQGGTLTAVSFGRAFISNPDLVERWRNGTPLANLNPATLYTKGAHGYTDYPTADDADTNHTQGT